MSSVFRLKNGLNQPPHAQKACATFNPYIVSNDMNGAMHSFSSPIMIGYDSIDGYIALLRLFVCVSAMLQLRR